MIEGQQIHAELDPARFRGEFLSHCAAIEDHAAEVIGRLVELGELKKAPHLFGQKFETVRRHVRHPNLWQHPAHVEPVLERLACFVALRGAICHALMEPAVIEERPGLTWRLPGDRDWETRKSMTDKEQDSLLSELARETKNFLRQRLKQF